MTSDQPLTMLVLIKSPTLIDEGGDSELANLIEDAMNACVPVYSLIEVLILGICHGDHARRFFNWSEKQIKDPDPTTTAYFQYNAICEIDIYQRLYELLMLFIIENCNVLVFSHELKCYDVRIIAHDDYTMVLRYAAKHKDSISSSTPT